MEVSSGTPVRLANSCKESNQAPLLKNATQHSCMYSGYMQLYAYGSECVYRLLRRGENTGVTN